MFAYIRGIVAFSGTDCVVIDNNGIGYKIMTNAFTINKLSTNDEVTIYTHLHVREDEMTIYGFLTQEEVKVFELLINISGIGPKAALSILSTLSLDELRMAIVSEDYKAISKANGIGAKTAQRVLIDLKDKFKLEDVFMNSNDMSSDDLKASDDVISETAMALTSLGYSNVEALKAIKKVSNSEDMTTEQLLSAALKFLI